MEQTKPFRRIAVRPPTEDGELMPTIKLRPSLVNRKCTGLVEQRCAGHAA